MKRFLSLLTILPLVVLAATAQTFRTTIPYHNQQGKLIAQVEVNGHRGTFLIDTGAPCCVSYSFAQRIGLQPRQAQKAQDSNGRTIETHLVVLDSLKVGTVTFSNLQALRWEKGNMTEQFGIDGIIGYNLMQMGIVKFDGRNHTFTLTSFSKDLGIDLAHGTPLLAHKFIPLLEVRLGKQAVDTVMFDSGATELYEMSMRNHHRLQHHKKAVKLITSGRGILSMGAAGIEQPSLKHRLKIPRLAIANSHFRNIATITTDGYDSRIGSEILNHGDVIIDYKNRIFYYIPHSPHQPPNLYRPEWDIVITISPEGFLTAGIVWNNKLPIRSGHRITAVNGRRYDQPIDIRTATTTTILSMPGNKAEITFLNPETGQEETITIRKR